MATYVAAKAGRKRGDAMVPRVAAVLGTALALGGCATSRLESFVGKDLQAITERYGPPARRAHLPNGTESFQWVVAFRHTQANSAPLTTFLPSKTAS